MSSNEIRMPFAEWLFRMSEARVPPAARELAIYAVAFKVSSNEELAKLAGMDTKGIADKTYNGWKKRLLADGWVILKAVTIGRSTTIEVFPACDASPVTFTDLKARDSRRFYESKTYETEVGVTSENAASPVEVTAEQAPIVIPTAVSHAYAPAQIDLKPFPKQEDNLLPPEQASASGGNYDPDFPALNGTAVDLIGFISAHANVDAIEARRMLRSNIQVFGPDVMMEAYVSTVAEMAGGMVASPYKYLIGCARKGKDKPRKTAPKGEAGAGETRADRYARKLNSMSNEQPKGGPQ